MDAEHVVPASRGDDVSLAWKARARPDEAHIAAHDIEKLGQFVQL
jgi:hypothetical protein